MQKLNGWVRLVIVMSLMLSAVACGQKGNLYLPEENALVSWIG